MTSADGSKIWRFGALEYDERAARIRRDGGTFALDRSSAAILSALLAAKGEAITKDRLLEIGWPGRVVHENSLAKAVGRLRKALGPEGPNLKAIYGAGYCLAVDAEQTDGARAPTREQNRLFAVAFGASAVGIVGTIVILLLVASGGDLYGGTVGEETALLSSEPADAAGRILWVDDHPENNTTEKADFEAQGIAVYNVGTTEEALTLLAMYPHYDAVISDMGRHGEPLAGFKLLEEMRARGDETPFYLYTILTSEAQHSLLAEKGGQGAAEAREDLYAFILPLMEQKAEDR